jgi:hypothetical protein
MVIGTPRWTRDETNATASPTSSPNFAQIDADERAA